MKKTNRKHTNNRENESTNKRKKEWVLEFEINVMNKEGRMIYCKDNNKLYLRARKSAVKDPSGNRAHNKITRDTIKNKQISNEHFNTVFFFQTRITLD